MKNRMISAGVASLCSLIAGACEDRDKPPPRAPAPDNTAVNERDRSGATKTPGDQSESAADVRISADVRKAIMDDSSMSTDAKNCKVITENGVVTLRGVVNSQAEKDAIEAKAAAVSGVLRVVNELEIASR